MNALYLTIRSLLMDNALNDALTSAQAALAHIGPRNIPGDAENLTRDRLRAIIQSVTRAGELGRTDNEIVGDTAVAADVSRDFMQMVSDEREKEEQERNMDEDVDFVDKIHKGGYPAVAKLIGFVSEFADEDTHGLISPVAKRAMAIGGGTFPESNRPWQYFVSDKLEAHCREVTEIIRVRHARRLPQVTTSDIVKWQDKGDSKAILTAYCRCVATRWRTSSIIAGQQYKSTKMIDTIKQAFLENLSFFSGVASRQGGELYLAPPPPMHWGGPWGVINA